MELISKDELAKLCSEQGIKRRIVRELRYVPSEITKPEARDFLVVMNKSGTEGVLIYEGWVVSFERAARRANSSGRVEAIICDICATWQRGSNSASVSFQTQSGSITHLICGDFDCSLHVRDLTDVAKLSRTQLREHADPEHRITRLRDRLRHIIETVTLSR